MNTQENLSGLINILSCSQKSLFKRIRRICHHAKLPIKYRNGQYIYIKGEIPITVVSHLDTAGNLPLGIEEHRGVITQSGLKSVLGADDRAGVYAMLYHILPLHPRPNLLFTCNEERGCLGTKALIDSIESGKNNYMKKELGDALFFIQLDRRGIQDCVFYNSEPSEFKVFCESFGFQRTGGSYSDISEICDFTRTCGVNLSAGYFNEHSSSETLIYPVLLNTIEKTISMIQEGAKLQKRWELPEREVSSCLWTRAYDNYGFGHEYHYDYETKTWIYGKTQLENVKLEDNCCICGTPLQAVEEFQEALCWNCIEEQGIVLAGEEPSK